MMRVVVVDHGSGNLASAARALTVAAANAGLAASVAVSSKPDEVAAADRLVLPGQGAFRDCHDGLRRSPGLLDAITAHVSKGRPFLGICVGMQLMAERGLEHAMTPGFGWIGGAVTGLDVPGLRLPHMGWNGLDFVPGAHPLLDGLVPGDHAYFVHSYALRPEQPHQVVATADYGGPVPAMVAQGNCAGTQFHVEKSQAVGLRILGNFLQWAP